MNGYALPKVVIFIQELPRDYQNEAPSPSDWDSYIAVQ